MMAVTAQAQDPAATGDAYMAGQLATEDLNGTARYVGMGGAMDALGADISTIATNPAGIGLFRKSQVSGSFGFNSQEDGKSFQDGSKTNASFDQIGFVIATRMTPTNYVNFAFNFHKSRNFDYVLSAANALKGSAQCNQTAYKDINGLYNKSYLIESQLDNMYMNNMTVEQDPDTKEYYAVDYEGKDYEFDRAHTGYIGEYDLNLSGNVNNRFYWGLTVGINSVHYNGYSEYFEQLNSQRHPEVLITDNLKLTGYGYSIKAGVRSRSRPSVSVLLSRRQRSISSRPTITPPSALLSITSRPQRNSVSIRLGSLASRQDTRLATTWLWEQSMSMLTTALATCEPSMVIPMMSGAALSMTTAAAIRL